MTKTNEPIERTMFYGATPVIFERARSMRLNMTAAEEKLWSILRNKQMLGLRFKAQHPINQFIADFYCHKIKLVIEADGDIHKDGQIKERDKGRTDELKNFGIEVIRFTNDQILNEIEMVKTKIEEKCRELLPPAP